MVYEARHARMLNYALAGACLLLSIIGFAAAGIIPTESTRVGGAYPLVGWTIVGACFGAAVVFIRRAFDDKVQARADQSGILAPRFSAQAIAWDRLSGCLPFRAGIQRIVRFELHDPSPYTAANAVKRAAGAVDRGLGFGHFGINTTFYDRPMADLVAVVRHYRPDLFEGAARP